MMNSDGEHGVRINKCFSKFASRRQADSYVEEGRVTVNGHHVESGTRVYTGDEVTLDGKPIKWEQVSTNFRYLKHWKRTGVVTTTDLRIENNIIEDIGISDRIFPVGRLDEQTSGVILLTSDGRVPNAVLGAARNCAKEYIVTADKYVTDYHMDRLRKGIVINTVAQRDRNLRKRLVAPTLPCDVSRASGRKLRVVLKEGRNRQLRKMLGALGYTVRSIQRISFMGITLEGLDKAGDWAYLNDIEMALLEQKLVSQGSNVLRK